MNPESVRFDDRASSLHSIVILPWLFGGGLFFPIDEPHFHGGAAAFIGRWFIVLLSSLVLSINGVQYQLKCTQYASESVAYLQFDLDFNQ